MAYPAFAIVMGGLAFFWVAMLGLLWRRSLIGMLLGVLFGWLFCSFEWSHLYRGRGSFCVGWTHKF